MTSLEIKQIFATVPASVELAASRLFDPACARVDTDGDVWLYTPQPDILDDEHIQKLATYIEGETGQTLADWAGFAPVYLA